MSRSLALLLVALLLLAVGLGGCPARDQPDNGNGDETADAPDDSATDASDDDDPAEQQEVVLTIQVEGEGTVSPEAGSHAYELLQEVEVQAVPGDGWEFSHWMQLAEGDADPSEAGESPATVVTMDASYTLTAVFAVTVADDPADPEPAVLTMAVNGDGSVSPGEGRHEYDPGSVITLEASPDPGWEFLRWEVPGRRDEASATTTITMDASYDVTAVFVAAKADAGPYGQGAHASETKSGNGVVSSYRLWNCHGLEGTWGWESTLVLAGFGEASGQTTFLMPPRPEQGPWQSAPFGCEFSGVFHVDDAVVTINVTYSNVVVEITVDDDTGEATMHWTCDILQVHTAVPPGYVHTTSSSDTASVPLLPGCR